MSHTFTVTLQEEIARVLKRVASEITAKGGSFDGNTEQGLFAGHSVLGPIKGEYRLLSDTEVSITIKSKPFIVPYGTIEAEIRQYFG